MLSELAPVMTTTLALIPSISLLSGLYHSKAPSLIAECSPFVEHARGENQSAAF
jgi:hypothetical protein